MDLSEIIEMLGFTYDPNKRVSRNEPQGSVIYFDYGISIIKTSMGFKVRALYDGTISADSLVDIGFEILKRTNAKGNNLVDCRYTTPHCLWLEIFDLRDVNY